MRNLILFSALCLGVSVAGRADTTFYLVGNTYGTVSSDGSSIAVNGSAVGTLNIDTVRGQVDDINVTVTEGGSNYVFAGSPYGQGTFNATQYEEYSYDTAGDILVFDMPVSTLVGYAGGNLCTFYNSPCLDSSGNQVSGYFGLLDNQGNETDFAAATGFLAQTPEPSSVVLLGTGLLAAFGAARRRVFARGV